MNNVSLFLISIFFVNSSYAFSNRSNFAEENIILSAIKNETNSENKEKMLQGLESKCPFKNDQSEISNLLPNTIGLSKASELSEDQKRECQNYLNGFNDSLQKTDQIKTMAQNPNANLTSEDKKVLESQLQNAMAATSGLRTMLEAQCNFSNASTFMSFGNNVINAVDSGSATLSFVNPFAAIVGAAVAATGRLTMSIGNWLFDRPDDLIVSDVAESEQYLQDLCSFRSLAQRYDKLTSNPFDSIEKSKREKEIEDKTKSLEASIEKSKNILSCTESQRQNFDNVKAFSGDIFNILEKPFSQKQCLNLLNNYLKNKKLNDRSPLYILQKRLNCAEKTTVLHPFCKATNILEDLSSGDIYEKCEDEKIQKNVNAKFTSLSDIIFQIVDEDNKTIAPINTEREKLKSDIDELQKLKEAEEKKRLSLEQFAGIEQVIDMNPFTNANTNKAMLNLGRKILGERFDIFAKKSLNSSDRELENATDLIEEISDLKDKLDGKALFSIDKDDLEKRTKVKKEMCDKASIAQRQLIDAHRFSAGIKDICDFTTGSGIPPLKSNGINYDFYSTQYDNQENNITSRCDELVQSVKGNFEKIKNQNAVLSNFSCSM